MVKKEKRKCFGRDKKKDISSIYLEDISLLDVTKTLYAVDNKIRYSSVYTNVNMRKGMVG